MSTLLIQGDGGRLVSSAPNRFIGDVVRGYYVTGTVIMSETTLSSRSVRVRCAEQY